jgi:RNA polymerase sigma factor (TIGR02999 family)
VTELQTVAGPQVGGYNLPVMGDLTRLLDAAGDGDREAAAGIFPAVYDELRRLAGAQLVQEAAGNSLNATALVHEAYLRLTGPDDQPKWENRGHFFAAAAESMRRILIDAARRKGRRKRGGGRKRVELPLNVGAADTPADDLLDLDEALTAFAAEDPVKAELVKLRFFAGLSAQEAADSLGISRATADRYWTYARAWLLDRLAHPDET